MEIEERIDALEASLKQRTAEKDAKIQEMETELSALKAKGKPGFEDQLLSKISVPGESRVGVGTNGYKTGGF